MGSSSSGSGAASVATRRRTEERVGGNAKKSKQEASRKASPPKVIPRKPSKKPGVLSENLTILFQTQAQAPKVKLGEKITALQQIVSPFGKVQDSLVSYCKSSPSNASWILSVHSYSL